MNNPPQIFKTILIGGGAAGLHCASHLNHPALLIEHNPKVGRKILVSGGGRCNFTNLKVSSSDFHSENPHFVKSAIMRFPQTEFIELIKKNGIEFYEKKLGQLFCKNTAHDVLNMLIERCKKRDIKVLEETKVFEVDILDNANTKLESNPESITKTTDRFLVKTSKGEFFCQNLVIATGGISFTKLGATGFGYELAKKFKIKTVSPEPALVPLKVSGYESLSGVAIKEVEVSVNNKVFRDDLLFTHKGLSGPAILKASLYWNKGDLLKINFLPSDSVNTLIDLAKEKKSKKKIRTLLSSHLPSAFIEYIFEKYLKLNSEDIFNLKKADLIKISASIHEHIFNPASTEGFERAEVTRGGVSTEEISSKSMESKKVPGLYFIGEVVDVTGLLGGYNFQWAWSSARAAAEALSEA